MILNTSSIVLLFIQISIIFALPAKQLRHSLMIQKSFHSFNNEPALLKGSHLIMTPTNSDDDSQINAENLFSALIGRNGAFHIGETALTIDKGGQLVTRAKSQLDQDDELRSRSVFSIKHGKLCQDSFCQFTLCPAYNLQGPGSSSYTFNHANSPSADCKGKITGVELAVVNQLGIAAKDFEAPEFVYNTGKRLFI